ncbi:MAG: ribonuclease R family protein [Cyanophyceae cyanobacterium]
MKFSVAALLSQFVDSKLVAGKVLEKKLGCEAEDKQKLYIALDILEKIGVLVKERGKYRRLYEQEVVEAKLRCSSKGFCFAIQDEEGADDIYVRESQLSNAWNGDRVLVKIIKEGSRRRSPEGEVKVILERANPSLLARVVNNNNHYRAIPLDDRLLFELALEQNGGDLEKAVDHLVHVNVLRYPLGQHPPLGQVTRILGSDAEAAADVDIVCCKHDLPQLFPEAAIDAAKSLPKRLRQAEIKKRRDFRNLRTLAIEAARENAAIENAFTLETTASGWQLGVHISDIAHYVEPDSPLDQEASKRGTTIYLGDRILPLFPEEVSRYCSLLPEKDRLCVSFLVQLDQNGQVTDYEISESVIQVDRQLTYEQVQSLLGNLNQESETEDILLLKELCLTLSPLVKAQRLQRGSYDIILEDYPSLFRDDGRLGTIVTAASLPIRSLLTELLVLVGQLAAAHLTALAIPGIYCTHPEPDWDELEDLLKLGNNLGLELELESEEEILPRDYQRITQKFTKSSASHVLHYLLKTTLKSIKYSTKPGAHFGLAYSNGYTHCASPGQRYVDLLVQRIFKTVLNQGRDRRHNRSKNRVNLGSSSCHGQINWNVLSPQFHTDLEEQFHALVPHLNEREKLAEDAETDLEGLKKAEQMKERTGQVFKGLITGVQSYGFFVEIEELLVEGLVHVSSLKDDWYEYRSRHSCLVGRKNRIAYRLGDRVEVEVKSVDYYRQQIDLVTVGGGSTASSADLEDE